MKSYENNPTVSRVISTKEMQSLAPRQNRNSMSESESRIFAICARIAIGILYFACVVAAIAQSPQQSRLRSIGCATSFNSKKALIAKLNDKSASIDRENLLTLMWVVAEEVRTVSGESTASL